MEMIIDTLDFATEIMVTTRKQALILKIMAMIFAEQCAVERILI